ncbi:unnamed protein product [Taenia asiatica]|uniref:A to I editase domain-containing protein n=1 Tax=Taenia asiatica TaxID=60517 RepID=A0A0R3VZP7_TAEAS|nr:unnamed protein product [Taenia asiatica]
MCSATAILLATTLHIAITCLCIGSALYNVIHADTFSSSDFSLSSHNGQNESGELGTKPDCPEHVRWMLATSRYFDYPTLAAVGHDMLLGSEDDFDAPVNMRLQTDEWAHQRHSGAQPICGALACRDHLKNALQIREQVGYQKVLPPTRLALLTS